MVLKCHCEKAYTNFVDDKDYTYQAYDKKPLGMFNPADEIKKSHKKLLKVLNKQYVSSVYESRISCSGDSLVNQLGSGLRRILSRLKDQTISDQYLSSTVSLFNVLLDFQNFWE